MAETTAAHEAFFERELNVDLDVIFGKYLGAVANGENVSFEQICLNAAKEATDPLAAAVLQRTARHLR